MNIFEKKCFKLLSVAIAIAFSLNQITPLYAQSSLQNLIAPSAEDNQQIQTITPEQAQARQNAPSASGQVVSPGVPNTQDFISKQSIDNQETQAKEQKEKDNQKLEQIKDAYELERYSFDEASDLLRPEFASAAILKDISAQDLQQLLDLPMEVGFAILDGELVMFTSGNQSEIDVLSAAGKTLQNAELIIHTHPNNHAITQPSGEDMQQAGALTEYVISRDGVYGYNHSGLKNNRNVYSYQFLIDEINHRLALDRLNGSANETLARQKLNEFIAQMDLMNQANPADRQVFRSGAVIAPNSSLGVGNLTALPVQPDVLLTGGSGAGSSANQPSSSAVHLNYALGTVGSYAGVTLNYDDYGKTPNFVESQDLSSVQSIVFGMSSSAYQVKVEFIDANNNKDYFLLTGVLPSTRYYQLNLNLLGPNVDRSKIAQINFIVDRNGAMPANYYGTLDLTFASLNVTGLQNADPTLTAASVNPLPGAAQPMFVGKLVDATTKLSQPDNTQVSLDYNLLQNDSFASSVFSFDNFATNDGDPATTVDVETVNLLAQGYPNNEIIVGLTGPAGANVRVEFEDIISTAANPHKDILNLGPLTGATQYFRLKLNNLSGIDLTQIKGINFVVDRYTVAPADGVLTPANRTGNLKIQFAAGLDVTGLQAADPTLTLASVTQLPGTPAPVLIGKNSQPGSLLTQSSNSQINFTYNLLQNDSFVTSVFSFDNFATPNAVETVNLLAQGYPNNEIIVGLTGPAGETVRVEFEDIISTAANPHKDILNLGPLTGATQYFRLKLNNLSGIDLTQIKGINFVVDRYTVAPADGVLTPANRTGNVTVQFAPGLDVTGFQLPQQNLAAADISTLPGLPGRVAGPVLVKSASAVASLAQSSRGEFRMTYDVTPLVSQNGATHQFSTAYVTYDNFGTDDGDPQTTADIETRDLSQLQGNQITVGLTGTPGMDLRVVFEDINGKKDFLNLAQLGAGEQYYRLNLSLLDTLQDATPLTGIDLTRIKGIGFEITGLQAAQPDPALPNAGPFQGFLNVKLNGLDVTGPIIADTQLTAASISTLQGSPDPVLTGGSNLPSTVTQQSNDVATLNYNVTPTVDAQGNTVHKYAGVSFNYDNYGTPATIEYFDLSAASELVVGLSGAPNTRVRVVFEDNAGGKDFLNLDTVTAAEKYYRLNFSLLDGVNFSRISAISFVVDDFIAGSFTGALNVKLNGLDVTGNILPGQNLTAANIITLPFNPGPVFINSANATGQVMQSSRSQARLTYNVTPIVTGNPPNTVTTHQFAGMVINYDNFNTPVVKEFRDLSGTTNFIFGLAGTPGMDVRVLFEDVAGGSDFFNLGQLGAGEQYYSLDRNLLTGVDFTRITGISFVVAGTQTPNSAGPYQGFLDVKVNGLDVTGLLTPDQTLTIGNVTQLLGNPGPVTVKSASATANLAQSSRDLVSLTYDVTPVVSGNPAVVTQQFAEALFNYDNFGTPAVKEFQDLSALTELVVGLSGTVGMNVSVTFEDAAGVKDTLNLGQLSAAEQYFRIPRSFIDNVNFAQITGIGFVVSGTQAQNPQPGGGPFTGNLNVRLSGLDVTGFIPASQNLTSANVTSMPNQPRPVVTGGSSALTGTNQLSNSQVDLAYDVTAVSSYSGLTVTYDNPGTQTVESGNLTTIGGNLVVGLRGPAGTNVRVEFIDAAGNRDFLNVGPVTTTEQFYSMNLALLSPTVNISQIANINFIITQALVQDTQDILNVRLGNLDFLGSSFIQPEQGLTAANVTTIPGAPEVLTTGGSAAGSSVFQLSTSRTDLNYDVTPAGSFSGINVNYDNAATPATEFQDFSSLGGQMIVGLRGPLGTNVRVEFEDSTGARKSLTLGSVNTTEQFYRLNLAQVAGIDFTKIRRVNFLVDNSLVLDKQDVLSLRLDGMRFTNIIQPTVGLTEASLTNFQAGNPQAVLLGGSSNRSSVAQFSNSRVDLDYDVSAQSSFSGAAIAFDNFLTQGVVETINLSAQPDIVVGVRGQIGDRVRLEIEDSGTAKASVVLGNINTVEQFYRIPLNLFTGINLASVASINFVVDQNFVSDTTNVMRFRFAGLSQPALTAQEQTIRQNLIQSHLGFFQSGVGIDPATHFPFDNITSAAVPQRFTQPTSIGFYLQILSDIAGGRISNPSMTSSQALAEANLVLDSLLSAQANYGWNGLIPFLNLSPLGPSTTQVATGDNANLAQSIAAFVGGLERTAFGGADQALATTLIGKANTALGNMAQGFQQMYDPGNGLFRAEVNRTSGQFTSLWIDRFNNEFRAPVGFVSLFYGINQSVFLNPSSLNKVYTDSLGNNVDVMTSFDGGAFQMFWPLLRANEEKYVEMLPALQNFLYAAADYAKRNNIPGLISASSTPENGYLGLLGVPEIGEINPLALAFDIGSVYALASAFSVAPSFVLAWLDNLRIQAPAISGPFGFFDSFRSSTEVGQRFFAIDQASLILGLADAGGDDFDTFMANRGLKDDFERLYEQKFIDIRPNQNPLPSPPVVPARTFAVLNNFSSQGMTGTFANGASSLNVSNGYTISNRFFYSGQAARAGHFFVLDQIHDSANETLVIKYTATTTPQQLEVELIDNTGAVAGTFTVPVTAGAGFREATVQIPNTNAFRQISRVNVLVNPAATGVTAADFSIHQLNFKFLGTIPPVSPNPALTVANVNSLPANFGLTNTGGSVAGTSINQISSSQFSLNINNQAAGNYGGASVMFDNSGTLGTVETQNFNTVPQLVVGLSSPQFSQGKLEFIDINGNRSTFTLAGITNTEKFWSVDLNNLAPGFDRSRIQMINFIVDTQAQGVLNVRTAGLAFTPVFSPDPTVLLGQQSTFNSPSPEAILTFGSVAGSTATQPSASEITVNYNNAAAGNYAGATLNFDNFGVPGIQVIDLSARAEIILGLRSTPNLASVKLEMIDAAGQSSFVRLSSVTGAEQFWRVALSNFSGINLAQVRFINVISDQPGNGNFTVRVNGQQFTPAVTPDTTGLTAANITTFPNFPVPGLTGGSSAASVFTRVSSSQVNVAYDVTAAGSFSGVSLTYAADQDLSTLPGSRVVLGVRRTGAVSGTIRVKLELVDASGMRATVFIDSVTANPSIYAVPFSVLPVGFDITKVKMLSWIVDQNGVTVPTQTGTIEVNINGIA